MMENSDNDNHDKMNMVEKPETICNICLNTIDTKDNITTLKCNHSFCYECIFETYLFSIGNTRVCPYCRKNGGYLPLPQGHKPSRKIHKEYKKSNTVSVPLIYAPNYYLKNQLQSVALLLDIPIRDKHGKVKLKKTLYQDIKKCCKENPVIVSTI
tara:strand:- start:598 stop:1062 length:465 start_codon:yes stop_codon:yes gene_type:complete